MCGQSLGSNPPRPQFNNFSRATVPLTTRLNVSRFSTLQANIVAKTKNFAKPFLSVNIWPFGSFEQTKHKGRESRDTVPLIQLVFNLVEHINTHKKLRVSPKIQRVSFTVGEI